MNAIKYFSKLEKKIWLDFPRKNIRYWYENKILSADVMINHSQKCILFEINNITWSNINSRSSPNDG